MNLSSFPTITKCKTLVVPIYRKDFFSQTFFPYDKEFDNSILKGIRTEYNFTPLAGAPPPYSIIANLNNTYPLGITGVSMSIGISRFLGITLVDDKNNNILQNYPICGLTQPQIGINTNYIRRFNAKINLQKSFILVLDKTVINTILANIEVIYGTFTFYYKPKN